MVHSGADRCEVAAVRGETESSTARRAAGDAYSLTFLCDGITAAEDDGSAETSFRQALPEERGDEYHAASLGERVTEAGFSVGHRCGAMEGAYAPRSVETERAAESSKDDESRLSS